MAAVGRSGEGTERDQFRLIAELNAEWSALCELEKEYNRELEERERRRLLLALHRQQGRLFVGRGGHGGPRCRKREQKWGETGKGKKQRALCAVRNMYVFDGERTRPNGAVYFLGIT